MSIPAADEPRIVCQFRGRTHKSKSPDGLCMKQVRWNGHYYMLWNQRRDGNWKPGTVVDFGLGLALEQLTRLIEAPPELGVPYPMVQEPNHIGAI